MVSDIKFYRHRMALTFFWFAECETGILEYW